MNAMKILGYICLSPAIMWFLLTLYVIFTGAPTEYKVIVVTCALGIIGIIILERESNLNEDYPVVECTPNR